MWHQYPNPEHPWLDRIVAPGNESPGERIDWKGGGIRCKEERCVATPQFSHTSFPESFGSAHSPQVQAILPAAMGAGYQRYILLWSARKADALVQRERDCHRKELAAGYFEETHAKPY